jgi:DNA-binding transcriptional LysR family regulator
MRPVACCGLSAPVGFARHVAPALGTLLGAHPVLRLRLLVDDAPIDLIESRIDLAIRFGSLADSTWAARRLCALQWWLCASPAWLAAHGKPEHPDALLAHQWLGFTRETGGLLAELQGPDGAQGTLRLEPRIASNNQVSIQQMCRSGLGLAMVGRIDAHEEVASGQLVRLLPA